MPGGKGLSFTIVDWNSRLAMFNSTNYLFTDTAIQLLSFGKVVICDRLHAAILSYLTGLPFVYINQSTGKLEKTLRVAFESWEGCQDGETSMYARAQNLQDALGKAIQFLDNYDLKKTTLL
jgi:exopolysaccharide biosynthesis predicted pyruvyltransferase EpsI